MKCPDCKGSGSVQLFTSAKPCATCGGTGVSSEKVNPDCNDVWTGIAYGADSPVGEGAADKLYAQAAIASVSSLHEAIVSVTYSFVPPEEMTE